MNIRNLIKNNIRFYKKEHLLVLIGVIISTALLAAALMIGDSVKYSLQDIVKKRLGNTYQVLQTNNRYFPADLANRLSNKTQTENSSILVLKGIASIGSGDIKIPEVQLIGYDNTFNTLTNETFIELENNEVIINEKLAEDLNISENDNILIRIEKAGFVNLNAPFIPDEDNTVSMNMKVKSISSPKDFGNFNLKTDQITPHNIFLSRAVLSDQFFADDYANTILIPESENDLNDLQIALKEIWSLEDINLNIRSIDNANKKELISDRIFIEDNIEASFNDANINTFPVFTYLVNFIRKGDSETPYSFAAAIQDSSSYKLKQNEIILNKWTADDLNAQIGDTIELEYYTVGALRTLNEEKRSFILKDFVPIDGYAADSLLMPAFEGLADVDHCSDWEAGIPMDYSKIRDKDEAYWDMYRGTPKAFISYNIAKEIWQNTQGNLTALRFDTDISDERISQTILNSINPSELGFHFYNIREESLWSADNAVDFAELFLGLSFFLILAAFILTGLLFSMLLSSRKKEQGILLSLGIKQKKIKQMFLLEGLIIAVFGSFIGLFAGILFNKIILYFLNSIWYDIVRTSSISLYVKPATLMLAFFINTVIAGFVIWLTIRRRMKQTANELNKQIVVTKKRKRSWDRYVFLFSLFIFAGIVAWMLISKTEQSPDIFFMNGFIILAILVSGASLLIRKRFEKSKQSVNSNSLAFKNLGYSRKRNLSTLFILSIGIFIVISTGMNRTDFHRNSEAASSGTGGYDFFVETNLPINADLNSKDGLEKVGLESLKDSVRFVQFSAIDGDDASCLNLNRTLRPRIIGFDPGEFINKKAFSFVNTIEESEDPWSLLNKEYSGNRIPAVADQTVIKWGLGKQVGDSISYLNEQGDTIHLLLVGGIANSVFQGNMLVSEKNFKKHYPSIAGSQVLLIESDKKNEEKVNTDLLRAFRNYGIIIDDTAERLEMFNSVTNTYLDIFLALGGIALILGTFGIAIVVIRSIQEQAHIYAMMQATGIKRRNIQKIIQKEHLFVLISGLVIGVLAAFTASLPALLSENTDIPFGLLGSILLIFLLNGIVWIRLGTKLSLNKEFMVNLRNE
jgi:putative ABC transport system permease protein